MVTAVLGVKQGNVTIPVSNFTKQTKVLNIQPYITGTFSSVTYAKAVFEADSTGKWKMSLDIRVTSSLLNSVEIYIAGLATDTNYYGGGVATNNITYWVAQYITIPNQNPFYLLLRTQGGGSGAATEWHCHVECPLLGEPNWTSLGTTFAAASENAANISGYIDPKYFLSKNCIINSNFDIWQRGTSFSTSYAYTADRWYAAYGVAGTVTRQADTTYPAYKLRMATTATGTGQIWVAHQIEYEDFKHLLGKQVTVSFIVNGLNTNPYSSSCFMSAYKNTSTKDTTCLGGAGVGTVQAWNTGVLTLTPNATQYNYTFIMPSDTLAFSILLSTPAGVSASIGDGMEVRRIWMTEGEVPMPYKSVGAGFAEEVILCQRFYEKSYPLDVAPGTNGYRTHQTTVPHSGNPQWIHMFGVTKAKNPIIHCYAVDGTIDNIRNDSTTTNLACEGYFNPSSYGFTLHKIGMTGGQQVAWNWVADSEFY